ncbi:silent information regulator family protein [Naegleria gruberi]|uniref:Silent information regulator family protein n=1 Tax=Naegleria gruberi TaxID=5762 RepID=D2VTR9_NAEGR|nr:silent information regulator family protein [Naegleria gruberi]EFC39772.1 silent information regulator family protein [Naegleria gruberi]|eukprot:XP_002672516.1 silent information regulator family protein [Naegleria gruberi strain NEG-M]
MTKKKERVEPTISDEERLDAVKLLAQQINNISDASIIVLTGAGLSTSCGIPDFRTPGKGLFVNGSLDKYEVKDPTSIFEIGYFKENPIPFFERMKNFIATEYKPSKTHFFIKLLQDKNKLMRLYTQNIDGLERKSGVSDELLVHCHGKLHTSHCMHCKKQFTLQYLRDQMTSESEEEVQIPKCNVCGNIVKTDVVLYGEDLPDKFGECVFQDLKKHKNCKLFIVIGTSLQVYPVALLPEYAPHGTMRVLINRDRCGGFYNIQSAIRECDVKNNHLDLYLGGADQTIDGCVELLVRELGWEDELKELMENSTLVDLNNL